MLSFFSIRLKKFYAISIVAVLLMSIHAPAKAQILKKFLDKMKQNVDTAVNSKANRLVDNFFNGSKKKNKAQTADDGQQNTDGGEQQTADGGDEQTTENGNGTRPKLSELNDADFVQNAAIPPRNPANTRFPIAGNLMIDIKGTYPNGYTPKWRFISYPSDLIMDEESWYYPRSTVQKATYPLSITTYNGKAILRVRPLGGTEAFADIVVKDSIAVITGNPQTFQITNFRRILNDRSTNEPIKGMGNMPANKGGFEGKLTLSANENGDITMSYMVENYSIETFRIRKVFDKDSKTYREEKVNLKPAQVSWRYIAKDINVENEMSAEKANGIIAAEKEAKQRQKDYIAKTKKQADSILKIIAKNYAGADCRSCFVSSRNQNLSITPTKTATRFDDGSVLIESGTNWDINTKTVIKNKCAYELIFVGIQQLKDEERGYYLTEVTKTMPVGYNYNVEQGLFGSVIGGLFGGGSEFDITLRDRYEVNAAYVGAVQWIKVIKGK